MGRPAADLQVAGRRRLRLDHRGQSGQLQPAWGWKPTAGAAGSWAWVNRQPINYPYELRYGRENAKRLAKPASVTGTITTPWRVVLVGRDLNTLVNSDILPNLCPPADPKYFPEGMNTSWVEAGPGGLELRRRRRTEHTSTA